ncbi:MAG: hypothetical protein ABSD86_20315 [Candidatus Sulfotelmatobacter sp.]
MAHPIKPRQQVPTFSSLVIRDLSVSRDCHPAITFRTTIMNVRMTADGKTYGCSFARELSDLFLVDGVR